MATLMKVRHSQLEVAIDEVFNDLLTKTPHKISAQGDKVEMLASALEKNQCYIGRKTPRKDTSLNYFGNIFRVIKKNKDCRVVLITWLQSVDASYCAKLVLREKIEGIKLLKVKESSKHEKIDKYQAIEWFKEICVKPLENSEKSERSSLFPSILEACKQEYVEVNDHGIYGEDDLQQKLKSAMINNVLQSKILNECLPGGTSWKEYVENNKVFTSGLPFCLLYASDVLSVNIRVLCFPSCEEVNFYGEKADVTLQLGLLGHDSFVPLIKVTKEDGGQIQRLEQTISHLKKEIKKLKEMKVESNRQKQSLNEKINKAEHALHVKEEEYKQIIEDMAKDARDSIQKVAREVAEKVTKELTAKFAKQMLK